MEKESEFDPLPPLAEYFVVAGISDSDSKDATKLSFGATVDPALLDWFPQSFQENQLRRDLPSFVFPEGLKIRKDKRESLYYTVAFTDDTGGRLYGCCLLFDQTLSQPGLPDVYIWKCICFLTKQSRFELMRECLRVIYLEAAKSGSNSSVESLIATVLNTPAPGYGLCLKLRLSGSSSASSANLLSILNPICVTPAPARGFPVADYRLLLLFERMGMAAVMDLLAAVLTERKVLFVSESFALLGIAAESLCALMYPLIWPYVFIPILPARLIECIEAPTPYIIGIHRNWAPVRGDARLTETFVADLDTGELIPPQVSADGWECHLPERHVSNLRARLIPLLRPALSDMDLAFPPPSLSLAESSRVVAVRALFLEFLLGILTQLTSGVPRGAAPVDAKATLRNKPDLASISFYEQLVDTQAFQQLFTAWTKEHVNVTRKLSALERYLRSPVAVSFDYPSAPTVQPSLSPRPLPILSRSTGSLVVVLPLFASPLRKNLIPQRSDQAALNAINDQLKKSPSAPLYLLQASLLLRKENRSTTSLFEALHCIEAACAKDEESLEAALELLQTVLEKQDDETLEQALKIGNYVSKLSSSILQWRSATTAKAAPPLLLEQTSLASLLPLASNSTSSSTGIVSSPRTSHSNATRRVAENAFLLSGEEMLAALQDIKLPSRDARMSKQTFAQFASRTGLAIDEAFGMRLFEALSRLGNKKTTIRYTKVATYVNLLKEIYSSHAKWATLLPIDQKEFVLYISDTRMLSGLSSQRGSLIVTNQRILFQARPSNSILLNIPLRDISRVEREQYVVIVPPGVPSLRLWTANKIEPIWFLMFAERDQLVPVVQSLSVVHKISSEISDARPLCIEINIAAIVCVVYRITAGANVALSLLSFAEGYAVQPFARMAKKLQKFGILNLDQVTLSSSDHMSELSTNDPLAIAHDALLTISDLMYAYVTHGGIIDLPGLLKCEALSKYVTAVSKLASVDLKKLSESEKLCFFVNVHNALVIHAYTIAGVPSSYIEWRYLCARACYCIGGSAYSLDDIVHGVLRGNQPLVDFAPTNRFELNDPRRFTAQKQPDLRALFVLCYHTLLSPPLYLLEPKTLERSLQDAVRQFLTPAAVKVNGNFLEVSLPRIFEFYRSDFGSDDDILRWIAKHTADEDLAAGVTRVMTAADHVVKYWSDWKQSPKPIVLTND